MLLPRAGVFRLVLSFYTDFYSLCDFSSHLIYYDNGIIKIAKSIYFRLKERKKTIHIE